MRIVWTRRYLQELAAVGDYIAERNAGAASRTARSIHARTELLLSENPLLGRKGKIPDTRELVVSRTS